MNKECLICAQCGIVFVPSRSASMCNFCYDNSKQTCDTEKKVEEDELQQNPQSIDDKVAAARALGVSYGQYSAMRRGLLKV